MSEQLTFLRADYNADAYHGSYAKVFNNAGESLPVTKPIHHEVHTVEVKNLKEARREIESRRTKGAICYIRGQLKEGLPDRGIHRRLANFDDVPRHLFLIDIDGISGDTELDAIDWREDGNHFVRTLIRRHLPYALHDAACYWYWSSSHMMPGKVGYRAHLWFWAQDPVTSFQLKQWAYRQGWKREDGKVRLTHPMDMAVFNPVQPHIIAKPQILGRYDPADGTKVDRERPGADGGYLDGVAVDLSPDPFLDSEPPDGLVDLTDWQPAAEDTSPMNRKKAPRNTPIGFVNAYVPIEEALELAGYVNTGRGRFLYPASTSGAPGVIVRDGHACSFHSDDPLNPDACGRVWSDSYDVLNTALLEEYGDVGDATYRSVHAMRDVLELAVARGKAALNTELGLMVDKSKVSVGLVTQDPAWPTARSLRKLTPSDVKLLYRNRPAFVVEPVQDTDTGEWVERIHNVNLLDEWFNWDDETGKRREWIGEVFEPLGAPPEVFNHWNGWPVEGKPGGSWETFKVLIFEGLCNSNIEHYEWLLDWMAIGLQQPGARYGVAIVFRGKPGTGKGKFAEWYGEKLFQQYYATTPKGEQVMGKFNGLTNNKLLLFLDEAVYGGDKRESGAWKALVTERFNTVELKFQDAREVRNYCRFILATNEVWAAPAGANERRLLVLDVNEKFFEDFAFFDKIDQEMANGGLEAMVYDLMHRKITTNQRKAPRTDALTDLIERGLRTEEAWLLKVVHEGEFLRDEFDRWDPVMDNPDDQPADFYNGSRWPHWVNPEVLYDSYVSFCRETGRSRYLETPKQLKNWLGLVQRKAFGNEDERDMRYIQRRIGEHRKKVIAWPGRDEMKAALEQVIGMKIDVLPVVDHFEEEDWLQ